MKHRPSTSATSFFETVSDLMFATMAIFVMLMVVFMLQVNIDDGLDAVLEKIEKSKPELEQVQEALKSAEAEVEKVENARKAFEQYNLEIVIAIDITGSMQLELDRLTDAVALIGEVLPQIANSVKIGMVAYRRDEQDQLDMKRYPLTLIQSGEVDNKRSYRDLYRFVSRLKAKAGSAPVEQAMKEALTMFSNPGEFTGHQAFMLLGDVGPYEDRNRDQEISPANRQQAQTMVSELKNWTDESHTRNVLILFSGDDEIAKTGGAQHQKFLESRKFFQALAKGTGQEEAYTNNSSEMIPVLLKSVLR